MKRGGRAWLAGIVTTDRILSGLLVQPEVLLWAPLSAPVYPPPEYVGVGVWVRSGRVAEEKLTSRPPRCPPAIVVTGSRVG